MDTRKIAAPLTLAHNGTLLHNTIVTFDGSGKVLDIETNVEDIDSRASVEYYDGVLIPGMVNAHCHLELSYLLGQVNEGKGLVEFIREIMAVRGNFTQQEQEDRAIAEDRKMWSEGVQGLCDISNGTASYEAKRTSNIEYYTYAEYFNMPSDSELEAYFARATQHVAPAKELGLSIAPTPHSTYMVGDKLFKKGADSERLSIHFLETPSELEYFEKKGGMYDFVTEDGMTPDFLHYGSHVDRIIASLPPSTPLLLVHNTMIKAEEIEKLTAYFTDVTFVLCPRSNYFIERSYPPAMEFQRLGVNVALGTDSLTSNHSLSMAREIEFLLNSNPELPLATALSWATAGGAKGLHAEGRIGSFEVGKCPGAVILSGINPKTLRPEGELSSRRVL